MIVSSAALLILRQAQDKECALSVWYRSASPARGKHTLAGVVAVAALAMRGAGGVFNKDTTFDGTEQPRDQNVADRSLNGETVPCMASFTS